MELVFIIHASSRFQVLPEKKTNVGAAMMGSAHTYDITGAKRMTADGIEVRVVKFLIYTAHLSFKVNKY